MGLAYFLPWPLPTGSFQARPAEFHPEDPCALGPTTFLSPFLSKQEVEATVLLTDPLTSLNPAQAFGKSPSANLSHSAQVGACTLFLAESLTNKFLPLQV